MRLTVRSASRFAAALRPPSDKSLTHRAILFAGLADGKCRVVRPLSAADPRATLECMIRLGLRASEGRDELLLEPPELWRSPAEPLDCGNSGTTIRLLAGILAGKAVTATLVGDESLSRRPMRRIADPLVAMGASIEGATPPLVVRGSDALRGIDYASPVASAQVKSAVLLAGLSASGETSVLEPSLSRDHTERMLRSLGVDVTSEARPDGYLARVRPRERLRAFEATIPGDVSSAAFWMVAAACVPGGRCSLAEVGVNPTRTGILDVFAQAGISVDSAPGPQQLGEPTAALEVQASEGKAFHISGALVPRLVDEIPVLAVLATRLEGETVIRDAGELRIKECDRIDAVAEGLRAMGAQVETYEDGMAIRGGARLRGASVDARGDHRIAMAFAIAGLLAEGETRIEGAETIATSYPDFEVELRRACGV